MSLLLITILKVIGIILALAIIIYVAIEIVPYFGGAAVTFFLALIGGPLGMFGGIITLMAITAIATAAIL